MVSHGITIQEPIPRPMKETLYSRHHSTVLPRLGSNRMENHQNLHTHAVDSAIQLLGNNRVLKKRPPPISDEEQRLNRRQRCVPTTPACTWWNRPEEDLSSGKSESTHPSRTVVKSIEVFYGVESVVRGNADSLLN